MHTERNIKMAVPGLTGTVGGKACLTYELVYRTGNVRAPALSSGKGKLWHSNKTLVTSVLQLLNTSSSYQYPYFSNQ